MLGSRSLLSKIEIHWQSKMKRKRLPNGWCPIKNGEPHEPGDEVFFEDQLTFRKVSIVIGANPKKRKVHE